MNHFLGEGIPEEHQDTYIWTLKTLMENEESLIGVDELTWSESVLMINRIALSKIANRDYDGVEELLNFALRIQLNKLRSIPISIVATLIALAKLHQLQKHPEKGHSHYEYVITVIETDSPTNPWLLVTLLTNLAKLYINSKLFYKAEAVLLHALEISNTEPSSSRLPVEKITRIQTLITGVYGLLGQRGKAEYYNQLALDSLDAEMGSDTLPLARCLSLKAGFLRHHRQHSEAIPLMNRAVKIREKLLCHDDELLAQSYINLAVLYNDIKCYAEAEEYYETALRILEKPQVKNITMLASARKQLAIIQEHLQTGW